MTNQRCGRGSAHTKRRPASADLTEPPEYLQPVRLKASDQGVHSNWVRACSQAQLCFRQGHRHRMNRQRGGTKNVPGGRLGGQAGTICQFRYNHQHHFTPTWFTDVCPDDGGITMAEQQSKTCSNCSCQIGKLETPHLWPDQGSKKCQTGNGTTPSAEAKLDRFSKKS